MTKQTERALPATSSAERSADQFTEMKEKLCIFCVHFGWSARRIEYWGSEETGPVEAGGEVYCGERQEFDGKTNEPKDEGQYRTILLTAQHCEKYACGWGRKES